MLRYTRNIGLNKFMSTVEKATLTQSHTNQSETDVLKQVKKAFPSTIQLQNFLSA